MRRPLHHSLHARAIRASTHVLLNNRYLLSRKIIHHPKVELHCGADLWAYLPNPWQGRHIVVLWHRKIIVKGVVHRLFSCFSTPSLLRRWYASTNILLAREIRVAAAFADMPRIFATSWYGTPCAAFNTSATAYSSGIQARAWRISSRSAISGMPPLSGKSQSA